MRVLVAGGAGEMGQVAAATIAADPAIDSVVVADLRLDEAVRIAGVLGGHVEARRLDVTDPENLRSALSDCDLLLNTVGPFFRFGVPVLSAAIEAGIGYTDINDDWEPTVEMFELHDAARAAGVTAVIGIGASPGISNMLAAAAARELDVIDALYTGWPAGVGIPKPTADDPHPRASAALEHWMHNLAHPIRVWRDGTFRDVLALEERTVVYPGIGSGTVWTCGHPEPLTLPRTYPGVRESLNLMTSRPGLMSVARDLAERVRAGELTVSEASDGLLIAPARRGPAAGERAMFPDVWALAEGTRDGRRVRVGASTDVLPEGRMGESTSIPLAICAGMLARGEIDRPGVWAPEAVMDPDIFFERLAPYAGDRRDDLRIRIAVEEF